MYSCLSEFTEEAFRKGIHNEGYEEGFNAGLLDSAIKSIKILQKNNISKEKVISGLIEEFEMAKQEAISLVNEYWK